MKVANLIALTCSVALILFPMFATADQCDHAVLFFSMNGKATKDTIPDYLAFVDTLRNEAHRVIGKRVMDIYRARNQGDRVACVDGWKRISSAMLNQPVAEGSVEFYYYGEDYAPENREVHVLKRPEFVLHERMEDFLTSLDANDGRWTCQVRAQEHGFDISLKEDLHADILYKFFIEFDQ